MSLAGPWRIEGEVARIVAARLRPAMLEADGRLRAKAFVTGEEVQLGFDGAFLLPSGEGQRQRRGWTAPSRSSPGGAVASSGQVSGGSRQLDLSGLDRRYRRRRGAARGRGAVPAAVPGTGSVALRARRLDADALVAALGERAGFERALRALPGALRSRARSRPARSGAARISRPLRCAAGLTSTGSRDASASVRVAGALIGASGAVDLDGLSGQAQSQGRGCAPRRPRAGAGRARSGAGRPRRRARPDRRRGDRRLGSRPCRPSSACW